MRSRRRISRSSCGPPSWLAARRSCSRARRSDARSRAPDACPSRAACSVYSTAELVGRAEAASARLLVEPGALAAGVAAGGAEDGVGQRVGRQRAVEELADLGVADRRRGRRRPRPHLLRMRRVSSTSPPASMTSTRAAMRVSRRSRGGSSSMTVDGVARRRRRGARGARRCGTPVSVCTSSARTSRTRSAGAMRSRGARIDGAQLQMQDAERARLLVDSWRRSASSRGGAAKRPKRSARR